MIVGLEGSRCHGEVSVTLCTTPSNNLNMCHSAGSREQFDICVTKMPAENNALTRLNVGFVVCTFSKSKLDTLISKNQR